VNERLEAAPGLYAAGDVAAVRTPGNAEPLRIEHWRLAQQHGYAVAREIVGWGQPFTETPFFWSQQHAKRLVYVGHAATWDEIVVDGDPDAFEVIAWFVQDGTVAAAFTCGREWATTQILELLKAKPTLTQARAAVER
jgi:NADPH-dependent 2,4-dienoyl-CoA reductase/sulfur reductase-like enzyme